MAIAYVVLEPSVAAKLEALARKREVAPEATANEVIEPSLDAIEER